MGLIKMSKSNTKKEENEKIVAEANIEGLEEAEETFDFEQLIMEGTELKIPIKFDFPRKISENEYTMVKTSAMIRPVSVMEWNSASKSCRNDYSLLNIFILRKGLLTSEGEPMKKAIIELIPEGVVEDLAQQIKDLSGIKENKEEQYELTKKLMGF